MSTRTMLGLAATLRQNASLARTPALRVGPNLIPVPAASFSTRRALMNKGSTTKDAHSKDKESRYWKYDISFRTQMEKIVFVAFLAAIGSTAWYKDLRGWWRGIEDAGDGDV
ncbi:hypothetical protein BDW74DRAFT_174976 [Aspergillus multicolor]|uniref:uncharacterized protein n=1 Tax=Aspergillus multicolor TaxID=41759 RepID=UPI003CCCD01E